MTLYVDKINQFLPLIKTTIEICFIFSLTPWDQLTYLLSIILTRNYIEKEAYNAVVLFAVKK